MLAAARVIRDVAIDEVVELADRDHAIAVGVGSALDDPDEACKLVTALRR